VNISLATIEMLQYFNCGGYDVSSKNVTGMGKIKMVRATVRTW
jgi:hypothetical protein